MKHIVRVSGLQTHSDWCRFGTETVRGELGRSVWRVRGGNGRKISTCAGL